MKILGIAATLPSKKVTNDDVLHLIRQHSKESFQGDLDKALKIIRRMFEISGIESRHWLDQNESIIELLKNTFTQALSQANLKKEDIDLLIFTGVGQGVLAPENGAGIVAALDLNCRSFDILDACMGWVSCMDVANDLMLAGAARNIMIVNLEFNLIYGSHIFPKNFELNSIKELHYKFPSYTVGEAVTVTIVGHEKPENFEFEFINRPDLYDLCTISVPSWQYFCRPSDRIKVTGGAYQFTSHGGELHETGWTEPISAFHKLTKRADREIKLTFPHTSAKKQWEGFARAAGIEATLSSIGHKVGNVVTASIPMGIVMAKNQGQLNRGDVCLGWQGSAGMSFAAMRFEL